MSRRAHEFGEGEMRVCIMRVSVCERECAWVLLRGVSEEWLWMCLAEVEKRVTFWNKLTDATDRLSS